jgi:hypothetical protein
MGECVERFAKDEDGNASVTSVNQVEGVMTHCAFISRNVNQASRARNQFSLSDVMDLGNEV